MPALRLLTYNVKLMSPLMRSTFQEGRPPTRGAPRPTRAWWEAWMTDRARTTRLVEAICRQGYDIVCLQEVFDESRRAQLKKGFIKRGLSHVIDYSRDRDLLHEDSGLFLASRYPIRWQHFEEYEDAAGSDAWADKGISCAAIDVAQKLSGTTLILFHTHMQAYDKQAPTRAKQIDQLMRKVRRVAAKLREPESCAIAVCGDFNVPAERLDAQGKLQRTPEYRALKRKLGTHRDLFRTAHPKDPGFTSDGLLTQKMRRRKPESRKRLDYVFALDRVRTRSAKRPTADLRKLVCESAKVEEFFDAKKKGHLSDHFALGVHLR